MTRNEYLAAARNCIRLAYKAKAGGYWPGLYLQASRNWIEAARMARETARVVRS